MLYPKFRSWIFLTLGVLLLLLGLYNSFKASFALTFVNSDVADTAILWDGVHQYGWIFVKSWMYTIDNWLLSLLPLHFLLFEIFGANTKVILWSGYLIFLANVILCGLIAYSINARIASILVPVVLLFSNYFTYLYGMIAFPISHNITNLYGLICFLFVIKWMKNPRFFHLVIIFFCIVVAGLSDPWLLPCYAIPILLSQFILLIRSQPTHKINHNAWLIVTLMLALLIIATKFFGIFSYVKSTELSTFSFTYLFANFDLFLKALGGLLNLIPDFLQISHSHLFLVKKLSIIIIFILSSAIAIDIITLVRENPVRLNFFLTIIFSFLLLMVSFCLLNTEGVKLWTIDLSRYLINLLFLLILGIAVSIEFYWHTFHKALKIALTTVSLLYVFTSISSTYPLWKQPTNIKENEFTSLTNFLSTNHLTYGYADYWKANIVTLLSKNKIRVRSIKFSKKNGTVTSSLHFQTSKLWYLPNDLPTDTNETFIIVEKGYSLCNDIQSCTAKLTQQFGPPAKILTYKDNFIMIWNHPLLDTIRNAPAEQQ